MTTLEVPNVHRFKNRHGKWQTYYRAAGETRSGSVPSIQPRSSGLSTRRRKPVSARKSAPGAPGLAPSTRRGLATTAPVGSLTGTGRPAHAAQPFGALVHGLWRGSGEGSSAQARRDDDRRQGDQAGRGPRFAEGAAQPVALLHPRRVARRRSDRWREAAAPPHGRLLLVDEADIAKHRAYHPLGPARASRSKYCSTPGCAGRTQSASAASTCAMALSTSSRRRPVARSW